ncbi:MAG: hypothetical protein IJE22_02495 [Oscillibacter sp.]|nr:hypothetical protein [Oscillibacter sp.]
MKKNAFAIASIVLNILLLLMVLRLGGRVEELRSDLRQEIRNVETMVENDLALTVERLDNAIAESEKLHSAWELTPTGVDTANRKLLAEVSVTLKAWSADTTVSLAVTEGDAVRHIPMEGKGSGVFAAAADLFVDGEGAILLAADITTGGVTRREDLGSWGDIAMLLPLQLSSWGGTVPYLQDGNLVISSRSVELMDAGEPAERIYGARAYDTVFTVRRNGAVEKTVTGQETYEMERYEYWLDSVFLPAAVGDTVSLSFTCSDAYGLRYEFLLSEWTVQEASGKGNGPMEAVEYGGGRIEPTLTWE